MGGRGKGFFNWRGSRAKPERCAGTGDPEELPGLPCLPTPSETAFGTRFREALTVCRLPYIQIVEAGDPGAPDYGVCCPPAGAVCYVELKVDNNRLEESQKRFFPRLLRAGCELVVLRHRGNLIERWDGMMQKRIKTYPPFEKTIEWKSELFTNRR